MKFGQKTFHLCALLIVQKGNRVFKGHLLHIDRVHVREIQKTLLFLILDTAF